MHVKPTKTQRLFVAVENTYKFRGGENMRTIFGLSCHVAIRKECESEKAGSTPGCSQAVPHPSTNRALRCLTSEVGRDPVDSTRYGRQRTSIRASKLLNRPSNIFANLDKRIFPCAAARVA